MAREIAPRAWAAIEDLLGGEERVEQAGSGAVWDSVLAGNFGSAYERTQGSWQPPTARDEYTGVPLGGWHKDGGHFRHFLDSPEQGLLTIVFWSDVHPRCGGTFAALDSVGVVSRFLAQHPEGIHADSVQGSGYLIPPLISECTGMVELTGEAGDVCLMHPFVLHRISGNPSGRARFISNPAVRLREPMDLNREDPNQFSAVESAILRGLGVPRFAFKPTRPRLAIPFGGIGVRTPQQRKEHLQELDKEKAKFAAQGVVWDKAYDVSQWGITREEIMAELEPRGRAFVSKTPGAQTQHVRAAKL
eukprot:COSAG03_NODE_200_length_10751_cov_2.905745_9_plen_304_part_00